MISSSSSWSKTALCIFKEQIWLPNRKCYRKKTCFDQEEMLKMAWYSMYVDFWMGWFQWHRFWGCTFRCFWVMGYTYALSWKLLIIGLLLEYFATLLKDYTWENSCKMFHISSPIVLFSYGKVKDILGGIRIKFHLGRTKGRGKWGFGGEAQNEVLFCKIPIIKQDTNFFSQTVGHKNF